MFGVVTVQAYIYLSKFPNERLGIKLTVSVNDRVFHLCF